MGEHPHERVAPVAARHVHESSDVAIRPLATFMAFLVVSLLILAVFVAWLFGWFLAHTNIEVVSRLEAPEVEFKAPALQVSPRRDLVALREREYRQLAATEWIDREQGIVRIPIERAIELVAERGFPDWPKTDVTPPRPAGEQPVTSPPFTESGAFP